MQIQKAHSVSCVKANWIVLRNLTIRLDVEDMLGIARNAIISRGLMLTRIASNARDFPQKNNSGEYINMIKCPRCGKTHIKVPKSHITAGTAYVLMWDCDKCGRAITAEGIKGVKPPQVQK